MISELLKPQEAAISLIALTVCSSCRRAASTRKRSTNLAGVVPLSFLKTRLKFRGLIAARLASASIRAASTCGKHYLRPAAIAAGVIAKDDHSRFGWHNLRHSLATFFASNEVHPSVIQTMLRHTKSQTTARYIHAVNTKQIEGQGKYLDAIKIGTKHPEQAA